MYTFSNNYSCRYDLDVHFIIKKYILNDVNINVIHLQIMHTSVAEEGVCPYKIHLLSHMAVTSLALSYDSIRLPTIAIMA